MRIIFIVGDHTQSGGGRGREEAEQFAAAACTVLAKLEDMGKQVDLFYYCDEQGLSGCKGTKARFNYTFQKLKKHNLSCDAMTKARLQQKEGNIHVRMNWPTQELIQEVRGLMNQQRVALFLFAHGGGGGIELGHISGGMPKEFLPTHRFLPETPNWKMLFTLHIHCHAGRYFRDASVYSRARAEKRLGLGISDADPTQGHVMLAAAETLANDIPTLLAILEDSDLTDVYEQVESLQKALANSSNGSLTGNPGILYGAKDKVEFTMGMGKPSASEVFDFESDGDLESDGDDGDAYDVDEEGGSDNDGH
jgi:hypothetical protein